MARERVVIDTNVLISGLLSTTSAPAKALDRAVTTAELVATTATVRELMAKLASPKFDRYISREKRDALLLRLAPLLDIVEVVQRVQACRDPRDDRFLDAALNGRADVLVSGDKDLLALHPFRGIDIVTPTAYINRPA
jgi:putative PIN family toxin of toxin-antitoxin system